MCQCTFLSRLNSLEFFLLRFFRSCALFKHFGSHDGVLVLLFYYLLLNISGCLQFDFGFSNPSSRREMGDGSCHY